MIKEYKLTLEIDDELFTDIDIPYYSGPYHDWLKTLALQSWMRAANFYR